MSGTAFVRFIRSARESRHWSIAEMARRAGLTQPELSRVEGGTRMPTLRHVKGMAEAFSMYPVDDPLEPVDYHRWWSKLGDLAERARIDARSGSKKEAANVAK
jgi:transcriptional regulator with XRE-family HTH domain